MRIKILLIALCLFFCAGAFAQTKQTDYIKSNQLYLTYKKKNISFSSINKSTIIKLLGKPIHIKKEKWETNNAVWTRTYIYPDGEIVLEDNDMAFIDINKPGLAFTFKYKTGFTKPFTKGSGIKELIKLFPNSWANRRDNAINVVITGCDCSIIFETDGTHIKSFSLFSDES